MKTQYIPKIHTTCSGRHEPSHLDAVNGIPGVAALEALPLPPSHCTVEAPFLSLGNMYMSRLHSALRWEGRLMNFTNLREIA